MSASDVETDAAGAQKEADYNITHILILKYSIVEHVNHTALAKNIDISPKSGSCAASELQRSENTGFGR